MTVRAHESRILLTFATLIALILFVPVLGGGSPALADGYVAEYLAPFAVPAAINELGSVVGWNPVYQTAFIYDDLFGYVELPCAKGHTCTAVDINDRGVIAGVARSAALDRGFAVVWIPGGAGYELNALPPVSPSRFISSQAVAIDERDRVLGIVTEPGSDIALRSNFLWSKSTGYRWLPVPGLVVDLNDAGQVAGNSTMPYVYELRSGRLTFTNLSKPFVAANAHTLSNAGVLGGSVTDVSGLQIGAITDGQGNWAPVGGGSAEDHVFGVNLFGDLAGHIRGIERGSHCGVLFVEEGEVATLESYLFPEAQSWRFFEVAGITDQRFLAAEAINEVTGLPGLVRLTPAKVPEPRGKDFFWVQSLTVESARLAGPSPAFRFVARAQIDGFEDVPPTKVEATWVLESGKVVARVSAETGPKGEVTFTINSVHPEADIYITRLYADARRFDATTGILHATTGGDSF